MDETCANARDYMRLGETRQPERRPAMKTTPRAYTLWGITPGGGLSL